MLKTIGKSSSSIWISVALASFVLMVIMGIRQTVGLFIHPIINDKGFSITEVSIALAIGQLFWGIFQPIFGIWADKKNAFAPICVGVLFIITGQLLTI